MVEKIREKDAATTLIFFRHGKTDFSEERFYSRTDDPSLNGEGRLQAENLGRWIKGGAFSALYASPLKRTMETAAYLSGGLNLKVIPKTGLEERTMGKWDGLSPAEVKEHFPAEFLKWKSDLLNFVPPEGESWKEFAERVMKAVDDIRSAHPVQRVGVVTHVGSIRVIVTKALEMEAGHHKRIVLGYGSATRIDYTSKWGNLYYLGVVPFSQAP